jgi:hypothetical protein
LGYSAVDSFIDCNIKAEEDDAADDVLSVFPTKMGGGIGSSASIEADAASTSSGTGAEATGVATIRIIATSIVAGAEATGVSTVHIVRASIGPGAEATGAATVCIAVVAVAVVGVAASNEIAWESDDCRSLSVSSSKAAMPLMMKRCSSDIFGWLL